MRERPEYTICRLKTLNIIKLLVVVILRKRLEIRQSQEEDLRKSLIADTKVKSHIIIILYGDRIQSSWDIYIIIIYINNLLKSLAITKFVTIFLYPINIMG